MQLHHHPNSDFTKTLNNLTVPYQRVQHHIYKSGNPTVPIAAGEAGGAGKDEDALVVASGAGAVACAVMPMYTAAIMWYVNVPYS